MTPIEFRRLPASHESYGLVMALLMENGGYETARFGPLARAVAAQVRDGTHCAAFMEKQIVAYAGYLPVDTANAQKWLRDEGELDITGAVAGSQQSFTVSVVCTKLPGLARRLLLANRRLHSGATIVFRRDYADGRARKARVGVRPNIRKP